MKNKKIYWSIHLPVEYVIILFHCDTVKIMKYIGVFIYTGVQLVRRPPLPFLENQKSVPILEKKDPIVSIFRLNVPFKMKF